MSDEAIPLTREFTVDPGFATRVSFALVKRYFVRRPTTWIGLGFILVAVALAIMGADVMWIVVLVLLVATIVFPVLVFLAGRRQVRRQFPVGTVMRTGFGPTRFTNAAPGFTSSVDYTYYSQAERDGEFVALRRVTPKTWVLFPGVLFGEEDIARFPQPR